MKRKWCKITNESQKLPTANEELSKLWGEPADFVTCIISQLLVLYDIFSPYVICYARYRLNVTHYKIWGASRLSKEGSLSSSPSLPCVLSMHSSHFKLALCKWS